MLEKRNARRAILTGLILFMLFIGSSLSVAFIVMVLSIQVIQGITLFYIRKYITVEIKSPGQILVGKEYNFTIVIKNESWLPIIKGSILLLQQNTFVKDSVIYNKEISLGPKKQVSLQLENKSEYCGCILYSIESLVLSDYFSIIQVKRKISSTSASIISPGLKSVNLIYEKNNFFRRDDITELRGYVSGDDIRLIHWKMTAKMNEIMLREPSNTINSKIYLIYENLLPSKKLDVTKQDIHTSFVFYASTAYELIEQGHELCLVYRTKGGLRMTEALENVENLFVSIYDILRALKNKEYDNTLDEFFFFTGLDEAFNVYVTPLLFENDIEVVVYDRKDLRLTT